LIYLDNAASTPVHAEVLDEMIPFLQDQFGNPSSIHKYGRSALRAIQNARKQIAHVINAETKEILITSGGTESNNTALFGMAHTKKRSHLIISSIEHDAILEPCKILDVNQVRVRDFDGVAKIELEKINWNDFLIKCN